MKPLRLLIVEDEYVVARDLEHRLAELGHRVAGRADNAAQAIALAEELRPDAVLMDIHLIGPKDGIDAAVEIRKGRDVPVIFLSAYGEEATIERAKQAQPYGYVLKPFDERELKIVLEMALARHEVDLQLKRANARLAALWSVADLAGADHKTVSDLILAAITEMTGAGYAFYGFLNDDESVMTIHAWSGEAMKNCRMETKPREYTIRESGLWAEAVRRRAPLIVNDFSLPHPARHGLPEGHVPLTNLLVVPVFSSGRIVSAAAAANRSADFTQEDVNQLTAFLNGVQAQLDRRRAEEELARSQAEMKAIYDHAPTMMCVLDEDRRVLYANPAFTDFTGVCEDELRGGRACGVFGCINAFDDPRGCGFGTNCPGCALRLAIEDTLRTGRGRRNVEHQTTLVREAKRREVVLVGSTALIPAAWGKKRVLLCLDDITERKRAEAALRESEQRWRGVLVNTPQLGVVLNPEGRILFANAHFLKLTGWTAGEVLGQNWFERFIPEDSREDIRGVFETMIRARETAGYSNYENDIVTRTGERCSVAWSNVLTKDARGDVLDMTCLGIDMSERKRAEAQLRLQSLVLDQIDDHVTVTDLDGRITYVNQAEVRTLGYPREELIGASPEKYGEDPRRGATQREILETTRQYGRWRGEVVNRTRDGREIIMDCRTQVVRDEQGKAVALCGIGTDITERKRAEEALREHESNLRSLFDAIHESVCLFEPDGRVVAANKTFAVRLGLWPGDVVGAPIYELIPQELATSRKTFVEQVLRTGSAVSFEDEREGRWMHHTVCPVLESDGTVTRLVVYAMDTTERRRAEEATRLMAEMLDIAPGSITVHNFEGRFLYANRKTFVLHGYTEAEFMALNLHQVDVPASERLIEERVRAIAEKGEASFEVSHFRKDGSIIPLEVFVKMVTWSGEPAMLSIATDITARKVAEEALRRNHAMLARTESIAQVGSWEWDVASDTVRWSDEMFRIFGRDPAGGAPSWANHGQLYLPEDMLRLREAVDAAVHHGTPYEIELRAVLPDGATRVCLARGYAEMGDHEKTIRLFGSVQDITARKQAEEALRESREVLNAVLDSIPVRVFWKDRNLTYVGCNAAFARDAGFGKPEDIIGKDDYSMGWREQAALYQSDDRAVIETGMAKLDFEEPQTTPGGERHLLTSKLPIRDGSGAVVGVLGAYLDISDRKRAEEEKARLEAQLRQAQKMESIGRLAGGVAHDFNNLLTVINGYSDLLLTRLMAGDPMRDHLAEIRKAGGRASELTRRLLAFSRRQVIHPRPVDLNELVLESRDMLGRLVGEDVEMVTDLHPESARVVADPGQLHQVLMNLVVNARDAMPAGGRLAIRTSRSHLDEREAAGLPGAAPGAYVVLEVSDTGIGISDEIQQHVFEPFFTSKKDGTGLGLSTVYGIVRQAGGWITFPSGSGMGTTFRIGLPIPREGDAQAVLEAPAPSSLDGSETVLVVEDQDDVRKLAAAVLRNHRYRILEARSGGEALVIAESHPGPIHLMVTDVVMPGMSGKDLALRLKPIRPDMKVLYMSGYTADVISHRGKLEAGAEYLEKPFSPAALALKVRGVLGEPRPAGRVLVVDDEEGIRRYFEQVLSGAGYQVEEAGDGWQAEKSLDSSPFDLMLVDLMMPGRGGIETIQSVRTRHPRLKIVAVSGAVAPGGPDAPGSAGADAVLLKPCGPDRLLETVRKTLGQAGERG